MDERGKCITDDFELNNEVNIDRNEAQCNKKGFERQTVLEGRFGHYVMPPMEVIRTTLKSIGNFVNALRCSTLIINCNK